VTQFALYLQTDMNKKCAKCGISEPNGLIMESLCIHDGKIDKHQWVDEKCKACGALFLSHRGLPIIQHAKGCPESSFKDDGRPWKESLMDQFCVMFERAHRDGDDSDEWVIKMETFISKTVSESLRMAAQRVIGLKMPKYDKSGMKNEAWIDHNNAIEQAAESIIKKGR